MTPDGVVAPTGRSISFAEIRIDRFAYGRIIEAWFIPDRMSLWQQMGLLPGTGNSADISLTFVEARESVDRDA